MDTQEDRAEPGTEQWKVEQRMVADALGWDLSAEEDPLVGLPEIAKVAGVSIGTPTQWRARTRRGELKGDRAFPDPDDPRYPDKPQWRAIKTIIPWLKRTRRWPPGAAGRPESRGPRETAGKPGARYVPA